MRSSDFKRSPSSVRVLKEYKPKPKGINWDRTTYLSVLVIALLSLGIYLFNTYLVVNGEGQVLFKKLDISFTDDVDIVQLVVKEGDEIQIGDTLFWYINEKAKEDYKSNSRQIITQEDSDDDWIQREIINTRKKIELSKILQDQSAEHLVSNANEKSRVQKAVYLDLYHADKLDLFFDREQKLNREIQTLNKEQEYLKEYLSYLYQELENKRTIQKTIVEAARKAPSPEAYVSPVNGVVTSIKKENYEVALESETIMSIHKPANLYVKAFLKQGDVDYLQVGDIVDVRFPDGTKSQGVIQRFHAATFALPSEFQKKYEPVTRSISADIVPIDDQELELWMPYYKLNVDIRKWKYTFFRF